MMSARVVFVVGHRRWGKSTTLTALAKGMRRYISLDGTDFFIRRMSNDDRPYEFYAEMKRVKPVDTPSLIVAFCPTMKEDSRARQCLERLRRKGYRLFFWVMRRQQKPGTKGSIKVEETKLLAQYGEVEIFERRAGKRRRVKALRQLSR